MNPALFKALFGAKVSTTFLFIYVSFCFANAQCTNNINGIDFDSYTINQTYDIAASDESGIARNVFNEDEFLIIEQTGFLAIWNTANGIKSYISGIDIGGVIYYDFEGLTYLFEDNGHYYAAISEDQGKIMVFQFLQNGNSYQAIEYSLIDVTIGGSFTDNLEGITYDANGTFYVCKENSSQLYQSNIQFTNLAALPANGSTMAFTEIALSNNAAIDFSDIHHMSQNEGCNNVSGFNNHILILSEESELIYEYNLNTQPASLVNTVFRPLIPPNQEVKLEGITFYKNKLYITQDNDGGGSSNTNYILEKLYQPLFNLTTQNTTENSIEVIVNFDTDILNCFGFNISDYSLAYKKTSNQNYNQQQLSNSITTLQNLDENTTYEIVLFNNTFNTNFIDNNDCKIFKTTMQAQNTCTSNSVGQINGSSNQVLCFGESINLSTNGQSIATANEVGGYLFSTSSNYFNQSGHKYLFLDNQIANNGNIDFGLYYIFSVIVNPNNLINGLPNITDDCTDHSSNSISVTFNEPIEFSVNATNCNPLNSTIDFNLNFSGGNTGTSFIYNFSGDYSANNVSGQNISFTLPYSNNANDFNFILTDNNNCSEALGTQVICPSPCNNGSSTATLLNNQSSTICFNESFSIPTNSNFSLSAGEQHFWVLHCDEQLTEFNIENIQSTNTIVNDGSINFGNFYVSSVVSQQLANGEIDFNYSCLLISDEVYQLTLNSEIVLASQEVCNNLDNELDISLTAVGGNINQQNLTFTINPIGQVFNSNAVDFALQFDADDQVNQLLTISDLNNCSAQILIEKDCSEACDFSQIGNDLNGYQTFDNFGNAMATNYEGNRIVVGAQNFEVGNSIKTGLVQIFEFDGTNWVQLGSDILGDTYNADLFGFEVDMSRSGNTIVIQSETLIIAFEFDGTNWVQKGNAISSVLGYVGLSGNGSSIVFSAFFTADIQTVYEYDGTDWVQKGSNISLPTTQNFGVTLTDDADINFNGNIIAFGSSYNSSTFSGQGQVYAYYWNDVINDWSQLGNVIEGSGINNDLGAYISMSDDGFNIAVSARSNETAVYQLVGNVWQIKGGYILSDSFADGNTLDLSGDGNKVVLGGVWNSTSASVKQFKMRAYEFKNDSWAQIGSTIFGNDLNDRTGKTVIISGNGNAIAGAASLSAYLKVFENNCIEEQIDNNALNPNCIDETFEKTNQFTNNIFSDDVGYEVDISDDGLTIAYSDANNDINIYKYINGSWQQYGNLIYNTNFSRVWGVEMNRDGSRIAVRGTIPGNSPSNVMGGVRVYDYNLGQWQQKGSDMGLSPGFSNVFASSMSRDGSAVSFATNQYIYNYSFNGTNWIATGNPIDLFAISGQFDSRYLNLTQDGSTLLFSDGNNTFVFAYDGNNWQDTNANIIGGKGSMTDDGNFICTVNSSNQLLFYAKSGNTWINDKPSYNLSFNVNGAANILNDGNKVAFGRKGILKIIEWTGLEWIDDYTIDDQWYLYYYGERVKFSENSNSFIIGAPGDDTTGEINYYSNKCHGTSEFCLQSELSNIGNEILASDFSIEEALAVDISTNGKRMIAHFFSDDNGAASILKAFKLVNDQWVQIGNDLPCAGSITLSDNGNYFAFRNGFDLSQGSKIEVYFLNDFAYYPRGEYYTWHSQNLKLGNFTIIGGNTSADFQGIDDAGIVSVYEYGGSINGTHTWVQKGQELNGDTWVQNFGTSMDITADGNTIIIGSRNFDDEDNGKAEVFEFDGTNWVQKGSPIIGDYLSETINTGLAVSITDNAQTIAVSSLQVLKTFKWNGFNYAPFGNNIPVEFNYHPPYGSIELSENGDLLALSQYNAVANDSIKVFVSENNLWIESTAPFVAPNLRGDVEIASDAKAIAFTTTNIGGVGKVKVMELNCVDINCSPQLTLSGNISSATYNADDCINANGTVNSLSGGDVFLEAGANPGECVVLLPGFEADGNVNLQIENIECNPFD